MTFWIESISCPLFIIDENKQVEQCQTSTTVGLLLVQPTSHGGCCSVRATSVVWWKLGSKKRASCLISLPTIVQRQLETVKLKSEKKHFLFLLCPTYTKGRMTIPNQMNFWKSSKGGGVNIFLPVFKSLKFSLQYEILNLEGFLQINRANYAHVVDNTNFHFQIP